MCAYGHDPVLRRATLPQVESADLRIEPSPGYEAELTTIGLILLLARAFSSGCAALTGVEAISNGVPAFRKPKSRRTPRPRCCCSAMIAITMMLSIIVLANQMGLRYVDPHELDRLVRPDGTSVAADYDQHAVIAQIARAVFIDFDAGLLLRGRDDRRHPGAGREHRVQRLPGAGLDPGQGRPRAAGPRLAR